GHSTPHPLPPGPTHGTAPVPMDAGQPRPHLPRGVEVGEPLATRTCPATRGLRAVALAPEGAPARTDSPARRPLQSRLPLRDAVRSEIRERQMNEAVSGRRPWTRWILTQLISSRTPHHRREGRGEPVRRRVHLVFGVGSCARRLLAAKRERHLGGALPNVPSR